MRKYSENVQNDEGYKIIAVDDEEGIIDSLSIVLKRSGYSFTGVTDPVEAIELIKKNSIAHLVTSSSITSKFLSQLSII